MRTRTALALVVLMLMTVTGAYSRTWTVMQDGTGDYTDIQAAVDGTSVGDTVLVGPGRYDQYHSFQPGDIDLGIQAIVGVSVDSLTIRGVDRETVIIGPLFQMPSTLLLIGVATSLTTTWINIENITFENIVSRGAHIYPSGRIADCMFKQCGLALMCEIAIDILIERCEFQQSTLNITSYGEGEYSAIIRGCSFRGGGGGVYVTGHPNAVVEECVFRDVTNSIYIGGGAGARIRHNIISGGSYGVVDANIGGTVTEVSNSTITGQQYYSIYFTDTTLIGHSNVLWSAGEYTIGTANSSARFYNNHILKGQNGSLKLIYYSIPDMGLDFTDNWWGTANMDSIPALIWDGEDDLSLQAKVLFNPFENGPVSSEKSSVGDVKRMFR